MQRNKGKAFERKIADVLRKRWPDAIVRRASQAERADNPDIFVEGGPLLLDRLWIECQDARKPTPAAKLEQADRDACAWFARRQGSRMPRLPVVVWHKLGERATWATMQLKTLLFLQGSRAKFGHSTPVTMDLDALLDIVAGLEIA